MKIAIVGAGVTGMATAHRLVDDGHTVTVFEQAGRAAEGASFAPGALVGPGWHQPWRGPARRFGQPPLQPGATLGWRRLPTPSEWGWLWRWRRGPDPARESSDQAALHALAADSHELMGDLQARLGLDHDRADGLMVLLRTPREVAWAQPVVQRLRDAGLVVRELDPAAARQAEPALRADTPLAGAIGLPSAGVANCREWTLLMRQHALEQGCRFEMGQAVSAVIPRDQGGVDVHRTGQPPHAFDAVLLCNGTEAQTLLRPLGLNLGLRGLQSCSVSAPVREPLDAPVSGVLDAATGITVARLGQRVRVSGGQLLSRPDAPPDKDTLRRLYDALLDWFPGAARLAGPGTSVQEWQGTLAMPADGTPLIGPTRIPGIWLNLGHGHAGWTLACGAARLLADGLAGRPSDPQAEPFLPTRRGL